MPSYTQVLYRESGIEIFSKANGQRGVRATRNLPPRTTVLVELGVSAFKSLIPLCIHNDPELSESLHPRGLPPTIENEVKQMEANIFKTGRKYEATLFNFISAFNHNCKANCFVRHFDDNVAIVITTSAVKAGMELAIMYSEDHGHDPMKYDWNCGCGLTREQRISRIIAQFKVVEAMIKDKLQLKPGVIDEVDPAVKMVHASLKVMSEALFSGVSKGDIEVLYSGWPDGVPRPEPYVSQRPMS
jgi:hypothetical protein